MKKKEKQYWRNKTNILNKKMFLFLFFYYFICLPECSTTTVLFSIQDECTIMNLFTACDADP